MDLYFVLFVIGNGLRDSFIIVCCCGRFFGIIASFIVGMTLMACGSCIDLFGCFCLYLLVGCLNGCMGVLIFVVPRQCGFFDVVGGCCLMGGLGSC